MAIAATRRFTAACQTETGSNKRRISNVENAKAAFGRSLFIPSKLNASSYVRPSSGMFSTVPHALQCTASLSWRCSPQVGQANRTL
jgi:hypothetical protein